MASLEAANVNSSKPLSKLHLGQQIGVRSVAVATTLAAACSMFTSYEATRIFGLPFEARYSYSPAFKFFAIANVVACGFTALSLLLFLVFVFTRRGFSPAHYFFLFLHDLVMMSLEMSACAAATAIGYLGKYGSQKAGWLPICDHVAKFCNQVTRSCILAYVSLILLYVLTVFSAVKSRHMLLSN